MAEGANDNEAFEAARERQRRQWRSDCFYWRGRLLTGRYAHRCSAWHFTPMDETCMEWPCECIRSALGWECAPVRGRLRPWEGAFGDGSQ